MLEVAPSTYYAAKSRPTSTRRLRDEELKVEIARVHKENFGVYGIEKVWRQLHRDGIGVGRDRVARLMREPPSWRRSPGRSPARTAPSSRVVSRRPRQPATPFHPVDATLTGAAL